MARYRPSRAQAQQFADLIERLEPEVRRGFMASVTDLQSNVNWGQLLARLEAYDTEGAIAALNIAPAAWAEYSAAVSNAYATAGASTAAYIRASGNAEVGIRFSMANPRAENWIRENVANRVVGFAEEQIKTARAVIEQGYSLGNHPHAIARDLAGRVGPQGVRMGGVIGLDGPRAARLRKVAEGMKTVEGVQSLVIERMDGSLDLRYKVNKSTGSRILDAYRKGEAVPAQLRDTSVRQYFNALLEDRAKTIAETETGNAVMSARQEEWAQAAETQGLNTSAVIKVWRHRRGGVGRPDHIAMSGEEVEGLQTPFIFPDGTYMLHAHDPNGGAKHNARCGCSTEYRLRRQVA